MSPPAIVWLRLLSIQYKSFYPLSPGIYICTEWPDNKAQIQSVLVPTNPEVEVVNMQDISQYGTQLKTKAQSLSINEKGRLETSDVILTLIPYYAWAHRGVGEMAVWLPQDVSAVIPNVKK